MFLSVQARTDGSTNGEINVDVDESGGTNRDYRIRIFADNNVGNTYNEFETLKLPLPTAAQYKIINVSDPDNSNAINIARELVL